MPADTAKLLRGAAQVISPEELAQKLTAGKPLRVKFGIDPTAPDLHLGHAVALYKLRQFQDAGHTVVFILGDYTAQIGDPSGRSETRPPLSAEEVAHHGQTYLDQACQILDRNHLEVRRNSEWIAPLFANADPNPRRSLLGLLSRHTVQQLTEREDFSQRLKKGDPVSLLELTYPILQGYDSVAVRSDLELGGTDQLFNLLMGRTLQKDEGQAVQVVMTLPLLEGTDGVRKMSKSYGNQIAFLDQPAEMFGKVMRLSDALMWKYYELLTSEDLAAAKRAHPMEAKKALAALLVTRHHGGEAAKQARDEFEKVFSRREDPESPLEHRVSKAKLRLAEILVESGVAASKNEARRLVTQGAVELAGERVLEDREITVHSPLLLKAGKRQFRKLLPPNP